jgi:hypothetical protein
MATSVTVTIRDGASYTLDKIAEGLTNRRPLNAAIGTRGEVELRAHFLERNQEPNKSYKGFTPPKQDFWNRIRKSTARTAVDESGATIAISDPAFAGKTHDFTMKPKEGKYLTLPAIAEAVGRSARTFQNLEPLIRYFNGSRRAIALVERKATQVGFGGKRKDGSRAVKKGAEVGGKVFYWLVESVRQKKDPRALPTREKMEGALREEAGFFMEDLAH